MSIYTYSFPTLILFGPGAVSRLPQECEKRGMRAPLIVTDGGLLATPLMKPIR